MKEELLRHGAFSWFELMTSDQAAAKEFYTSLFGWETEEFPMEMVPGGSYTVIRVQGEEIGGMMKLPEECTGAAPAWGTYVTVDDIDATTAKVEDLGGEVLKPPTQIPQVGRFSVLQDPQGAVLCAISYDKMD